MHVRNGERIAKFWIEPDVALAWSYELSARELKEIENVVGENRDLIRRRWDEFFKP